MDLFEYNEEYGILIYKPCAYAISPSHLTGHLATKHDKVVRRQNGRTTCGKKPLKAAAAISDSLLKKFDIRHVTLSTPSPSSAPILHLKLVLGLQYTRCPRVVGRSKDMRKQLLTHFNTHRATPWPKGARQRVPHPSEDDEVPNFPEVSC